MAITEGQWAPGAAVSQEGDVWIRLSAGGVRQRHEFMMDKLDPVQPAALGWVGYAPQGGAVGLHLAKMTAAHYHNEWVGAQRGLVFVQHFPNAATTWTISNHALAFRFVDITAIRAMDDWTYDPGLQAWTDPLIASRPVTIMMPKKTLATVNGVLMTFAEPVRGVAIARR